MATVQKTESLGEEAVENSYLSQRGGCTTPFQKFAQGILKSQGIFHRGKRAGWPPG